MIRGDNYVLVIRAKDKEIKTVRIKNGESIRTMKDLTGLSVSSLWKIENRITNPNPRTAQKICKALRCKFEDLFNIEEVNK